MKVRKINQFGSLVVGLPKDVKTSLDLKNGDEVFWRMNENGFWELVPVKSFKSKHTSI